MSMTGCTNSAGLFAARFFLGVPEAGVVTCGVMYFSFWVYIIYLWYPRSLLLTLSEYKPSERALRIGIFYSSNSIAQAISGFLAVGINKVSNLDEN